MYPLEPPLALPAMISELPPVQLNPEKQIMSVAMCVRGKNTGREQRIRRATLAEGTRENVPFDWRQGKLFRLRDPKQVRKGPQSKAVCARTQNGTEAMPSGSPTGHARMTSCETGGDTAARPAATRRRDWRRHGGDMAARAARQTAARRL